MKKILITGACGFIGSHLTEMMIEKGYNVVAFDRYNSNNDYGWLNNSKYKKDIEFELGDIRDFDSVTSTKKYFQGAPLTGWDKFVLRGGNTSKVIKFYK